MCDEGTIAVTPGIIMSAEKAISHVRCRIPAFLRRRRVVSHAANRMIVPRSTHSLADVRL
jgi:hypothetical protein